MNNVNNNVLNTLVDTLAATASSPGAGAERAVAVISALCVNDEVPLHRISKFSIGWEMIGTELVPIIDMEFHK